MFHHQASVLITSSIKSPDNLSRRPIIIEHWPWASHYTRRIVPGDRQTDSRAEESKENTQEGLLGILVRDQVGAYMSIESSGPCGLLPASREALLLEVSPQQGTQRSLCRPHGLWGLQRKKQWNSHHHTSRTGEVRLSWFHRNPFCSQLSLLLSMWSISHKDSLTSLSHNIQLTRFIVVHHWLVYLQQICNLCYCYWVIFYSNSFLKGAVPQKCSLKHTIVMEAVASVL